MHCLGLVVDCYGLLADQSCLVVNSSYALLTIYDFLRLLRRVFELQCKHCLGLGPFGLFRAGCGLLRVSCKLTRLACKL